jgi:alpha-mannosidase
MQKHYEITRRRVKAFLDASRLGGKMYAAKQPVTLTRYAAPDRITYDEAMRGDYQPLNIGTQLTPIWSTHWVKVEYAIPEAWRGGEVYLLWDSTSEGCVWIDGQPEQGLTGTASYWGEFGPMRMRYRLTQAARGGETGTLYIEVAVNTLFGSVSEKYHTVGLLRQAELALFDREAWNLYWDMFVIVEMTRHLPENSPRAFQALDAANAMVNAIHLDDRSTWAKGREIAAAFLAEKNGDSQHLVYAMGHAHIDTAWLWTIAETKRKIVRSVTNALRNIEDYPDFVYVFSQAQQYAWLKAQQPALYERLKAAIKAKRIVPVGGTWVEPDCNLPTGESLVRQFLYGQRFFEQEFGIRCEEFWLPDTFGYPPALPQIMRGAGAKYFLSQKLSWNQFNKPDRSTFIWEGLDGSQVLAHFPPADTYNGSGSVQELMLGLKNFKDHERARESMYIYGWGDGGGGPTDEMLERLGRLKDVDGVPKVTLQPPSAFFKQAEQRWDRYTKWVGELYFEYHRGTYTTQARNKRHNRQAEILLRDVELLSAIAMWQVGYAYPQAEIERLWKLVLLNQFHDILPGSSITAVYQDSERDYADVLASGARLRQAALDALVPPCKPPCSLGIINTTGVRRQEVIETDVITGTQTTADGKALVLVEAQPFGLASYQLDQVWEVSAHQEGELFILENAHLRAAFRADGRLVSLYSHQAEREAITGGGGNQFILYDDNPLDFEAWDIDVFHQEKHGEPLAATWAEIVEAGSLRAAIRFTYETGAGSKITQTVSLTCVAQVLEFAHSVDWRESRKLLRLEFPVNVRSDFAAYEMQHGFVRRPTHYNTSWDLARFEVPAHRWADLSEPGFGVALLNDCKYGYRIHENVIGLTVLRSPKSPDPVADIGTHEFRCGLLMHTFAADYSDVIREGIAFNTPLLIRGSADYLRESFFEIENAELLIDAVKKAEDSDDLIMRLYEPEGFRGTALLGLNLPVRRAALCNLLEEETAELPINEGVIEIEYTPFQLITLKLSR